MLYVEEYGQRGLPSILLLHGAGVLDTFSQQYCLSETYHLIVPHLDGAGKAAGIPYDPHRLTDELFATIVEHYPNEQIGVIGHSLGAQLAIRLVAAHPERFFFAVFLSAWITPSPRSIYRYCRFAGISSALLHQSWLMRLQANYWHFTRKETEYLVAYSKDITASVYQSFFINTLDLRTLPAYFSLSVPMLALCGQKEIKDMKTSLTLLGKNPHCETAILPHAGHDFPMRQAYICNQILSAFIHRHFPI